MSNDLDELMNRDPLDLSSQDIDAIIAYHRNIRARKEAREKIKKPAKDSVDISGVVHKMLTEKKPILNLKRRV